MGYKMQLFCYLIRAPEIWEVDCFYNLPSESALGTSDLNKFIKNKTRKRETVSYNKTIGAFFFG